MKIYLDLLISFFKVGILTFGGGYAMLPMLQREIIERRKWASEQEVMDYYAIGQCTPGIIAVNTATFIGSKHKGVLGGFVATIGLIIPSLIIISVLAALLINISAYPVVQHALAGIRIAVVVLVINSVIKLFKSSVKNGFGWVTFVLVYALSVFIGVSPLIIILLAIILSVVYTLVMKKRGTESCN